MKAAYYLGDKSFNLKECRPVQPKRGEVRLAVSYCGVCGTDIHIYRGHMDERVEIPQVIGHEMSAVVVEVGPNVTGFGEGDQVVVRPLLACGNCSACNRGLPHICRNLNFMGIDSPGAFQYSWTVPARTLHKLPPGTDLQMAAFTEPLAVACHDVRIGQVAPGETVVVIGGGPIGTLIALVARHIGAKIIMSEINRFRREVAIKAGIEVVDPVAVDLLEHLQSRTDGEGADVVFEVSGSRRGAAAMTGLCRPRGRIVIVAIFGERPEIDLFSFFWSEIRMCGARVYEPEDYEQAIELIHSGNLPLQTLTTSVRPLEELAEVFTLLDQGADEMKALIDCRP